MKKIVLICTAILLIYNICFATIRRVGYAGVARPNVDYSNFQDANDAADAGDTIQIYGNVIGGNVTKKLVLIGFGYNFDANANLQAVGTDQPSKCALYFDKGSNGTMATGISGDFYIYDQSGTHAPISNITFFRCFGSFVLYNNESYGPINNINIFSCVLTSGGMNWNGPADYNATNINLFNCILQGAFNMYKPGSTVFASNCVSVSNTILGGFFNFNDAGGLVNNCILGSSNSAQNTNTIYNNCFFQEGAPNPLPPGTNNHWDADFAAIFTRNGRSDDNASYYGNPEFDEDYWVLKPGSPAINSGIFNGAATDCGIYGGDPAFKYKLSGVPAVPAIYKLTAPSINTSGNPYNVTISVRSNN